jgi:cysteine sulfinate desulfinase/cysteine desulfurase-like protein
MLIAVHATAVMPWHGRRSGTIALAAVTAMAVIASIVMAIYDRRHADERLQRQLRHSEAQLKAEWELALEREQEQNARLVRVGVAIQDPPGFVNVNCGEPRAA